MKILSAPKEFDQTGLVDKKIEKHFRPKETIFFLKAHFHKDVVALHKYDVKNEIRLHLKGHKEPVVIGMPEVEKVAKAKAKAKE